jgi:hypothetical protein
MEKWDGIVGAPFRPRKPLQDVLPNGQQTSENPNPGVWRTVSGEVATRDGKKLTDSVMAQNNAVPFEYWVNLSGSVVQLSVKSNREWRVDQMKRPVPVKDGMNGSADNDGYYRMITSRKRAAGWLRVDDFRDEKNPDATKRPTWLIDEVTRRRTEQATKTEEQERSMRGSVDKLIQALAQNQRDTISQLSEAIKAVIPTRKAV